MLTDRYAVNLNDSITQLRLHLCITQYAAIIINQAVSQQQVQVKDIPGSSLTSWTSGGIVTVDVALGTSFTTHQTTVSDVHPSHPHLVYEQHQRGL